MDNKYLLDFIPEPIAWIRAAVSSIPIVGSAFDHLVFDKADAIRLRNIEAALKALADQVQIIEEEKIDKQWFSSKEALAVFMVMWDAISYEPEREKIDDIGRIVAVCGAKKHSADERKLSVVEHISKLSHTQIKLLSILVSIPMQQKKIETGGLLQTATAIWLTEIMASLKSGQKFWTGKMILNEELEVLESLNTIRRVNLMGQSEAAYVLTAIGARAASYVRTAGL